MIYEIIEIKLNISCRGFLNSIRKKKSLIVCVNVRENGHLFINSALDGAMYLY